MIVCLGAAAVTLALAPQVTLSWTHSVQKTEWQEVWEARPDGLMLREARVKGSGAGIDPPPEARLKDGFYVWEPRLPPRREVVLRRSGATEDWRICTQAGCRTVAEMAGEADPVRLTICGS